LPGMSTMKLHSTAIGLAALVSVLGAGTASAQWNPKNGEWGKEKPDQVRMMTWNVFKGIRASAPKIEGDNQWTALARIVATLKPDVLLLQETGDNGCEECVDTVAELTMALDLFLHGGVDPFLGGSVTSYVQKYAPAYDLPFVFVSSATNGRTRNVILSRYPFQDLNGDGESQYSDAFASTADAYAPGTATNPFFHGLQFAELDLPDAEYQGDLVVMNAHLMPGATAPELQSRITDAQNWAYLIDYWYNGAGTGIPDPNGVIQDNPPATQILPPLTPVVAGGDWNEDEQLNGRKGPAEWVARAQLTGGTDGTDRDRSDSVFDIAQEPCAPGNRATRNGLKIDYLSWQDSIAITQRGIIFNTFNIPTGCTFYPAELSGFEGGPRFASGTASDHFPVVVDLKLPCTTAASVTFRNGTGVNPTCMASTNLPLSGRLWDVEVDASVVPGATSTMLLSRKLGATTSFPIGEMLVDLNSPLVFRLTRSGSGVTRYTILIPNWTVLIGYDLVIQGAVFQGSGVKALCNAEDIIIGCY